LKLKTVLKAEGDTKKKKKKYLHRQKRKVGERVCERAREREREVKRGERGEGNRERK